MTDNLPDSQLPYFVRKVQDPHEDSFLADAVVEYDYRYINGGRQLLVKFTNGYGASIVRGPYSYGGRDGLWELAVIKYPSKDAELDDFAITYDTPITDDVMGHLDAQEVLVLLIKIGLLTDERVAGHARKRAIKEALLDVSHAIQNLDYVGGDTKALWDALSVLEDEHDDFPS